jgi:hypothetical protein
MTRPVDLIFRFRACRSHLTKVKRLGFHQEALPPQGERGLIFPALALAIDYFFFARSMPSTISLCASAASPHFNTFTHLPFSRSL